MRTTHAVFAAAAMAFLSLPALAQTASPFQRPQDAARYRQSVMTIMNTHFGRIFATANGRVPYNPAATAENAEVVALMSKLPWPAFSADTEKVTPTRAKPEVWSQNAKFVQNAEALQAETAKLLAAARANNLDAIKAATTSVAAACKTCHDVYRAER